MKKIILIVLLFPALNLYAKNRKTTENRQVMAYIQRWKDMAKREMIRTGVPASITLAQAIIESNLGMSTLATQGFNFFGIKCHNWTGKSMKHDDDRKNECFRVYDSPEQSFRDHSDFLISREIYKPLLALRVYDYKSWALGLKKAGYATDPKYARKLIACIEKYKLYRYDRYTEQIEYSPIISAPAALIFFFEKMKRKKSSTTGRTRFTYRVFLMF